MRHALYLVGEPGAGKSTLVETLVGDAMGLPARKPLAHTNYLEAGVTELGARRPGGFGGTDALSMSAVVPACAFVSDEHGPLPMLLAEGDRLANDRFFNALLDAGWRLTVAHLDVPPEVAVARRAARGTTQNESWVLGRRTKVARLVERWARLTVTLDGRQTPVDLVNDLARHSPVARALLSGRLKGGGPAAVSAGTYQGGQHQ